MNIIELNSTQREEALRLAWKVFMEFEAPEYSQEGIEEFRHFVTNIAPKADMRFWGAYVNGKLAGMIAIRQPQHISLFFVDTKHQHKGIGRKLFETLEKEFSQGTITVNSSPYAVHIYHKLGFKDTNSEQTVNGIRFTPMEHK